MPDDSSNYWQDPCILSYWEVDQWDQLLFDGTGRCQTALQNLVICVIDEERLRLIILSTYIILKGETSEQQVYTTLSTISGCGERLQRWM